MDFAQQPIVSEGMKDALLKTVSVLDLDKIPFKKGDRVEIIGSNVGEVTGLHVVQTVYASVNVLIDGKPVSMTAPMAYLKHV